MSDHDEARKIAEEIIEFKAGQTSKHEDALLAREYLALLAERDALREWQERARKCWKLCVISNLTRL
jgi:hypothetical protein